MIPCKNPDYSFANASQLGDGVTFLFIYLWAGVRSCNEVFILLPKADWSSFSRWACLFA